MGVFNMSSAAFPALKESGGGAIINISMTLHYGATWFQAHASAAKAAIDSLTRWVRGWVCGVFVHDDHDAAWDGGGRRPRAARVFAFGECVPFDINATRVVKSSPVR